MSPEQTKINPIILLEKCREINLEIQILISQFMASEDDDDRMGYAERISTLVISGLDELHKFKMQGRRNPSLLMDVQVCASLMAFEINLESFLEIGTPLSVQRYSLN